MDRKTNTPAGITTAWYDQLPGNFAPDYLRRIRPVQQRWIDGVEGDVYCQIVGKDIAPRQCLISQFQPECLGCSAPSHLCHACRRRPLAFPAVELCEPCLKTALAMEQQAGKLQLPRDLQVSCLLVDRKISVNTCLNMQGERCRSCAMPSRLCQQCQTRPTRYPIEGLCLTCLVQSFGTGWEAAATETEEAEEIADEPNPEPMAAALPATEPPPTQPAADEQEQAAAQTAVTPKLLARAISAVVKWRLCHPQSIARQLEIGEDLAGAVRDELIRLRVIRMVPRVVDYEVGISDLHHLASCPGLPVEVRKALGLPLSPSDDQPGGKKSSLVTEPAGTENLRGMMNTKAEGATGGPQPDQPVPEGTVTPFSESAASRAEPIIDPDANIGPNEELVQRAINVVAAERRAGYQWLARKLKVSYGMAERIQRELERRQKIGPSQGRGQPREILVPPPHQPSSETTAPGKRGSWSARERTTSGQAVGPALLAKAAELIVRTGHTSYRTLAKELEVTEAVAHRIQAGLQEERVLSVKRGERQGRRVLIRTVEELRRRFPRWYPPVAAGAAVPPADAGQPATFDQIFSTEVETMTAPEKIAALQQVARLLDALAGAANPGGKFLRAVAGDLERLEGILRLARGER